MSNVEEHFAPEIIQETPVKRYASRGKTNPEVLEKENLMILISSDNYSVDSQVSDDEQRTELELENAEKKLHYLKLALGNEQLANTELKEELAKHKKVDEALQQFEKVIALITKNIQSYQNLLTNIEKTSFVDLLQAESQQVENSTETLNLDALAPSIRSVLTVNHNLLKRKEQSMRIEFQERLLYEKSKKLYLHKLEIFGYAFVMLLFLDIVCRVFA